MIRRVLDFVFVLLFVWACMILGLWVIDSAIVPLQLPGVTDDVMTAILKVAISGAMVLVWLWIWREMVKRMFWRAVKSQRHSVDNLQSNSQSKETAEHGKLQERQMKG